MSGEFVVTQSSIDPVISHNNRGSIDSTCIRPCEAWYTLPLDCQPLSDLESSVMWRTC